MILIAFRLRSSSSLLADTMIVEDWVRRALICFAIQRLSMTLGVSARQLSQPLRYPIQIHVLVGLSRTVSIVLATSVAPVQDVDRRNLPLMLPFSSRATFVAADLHRSAF